MSAPFTIERLRYSGRRTRHEVRPAMAFMRSRYAMADAALEPAVYLRLTDNWLEMSLRFLVGSRGVREVKDRISRQVLGELEGAGIGMASATYKIVGSPEVRLAPARSLDRPAL